jgi:hypothetical protein
MKDYSLRYCLSSIEKLPTSNYSLTIQDLNNHELDCFYFKTLEETLNHYRLLFGSEAS